MAINRFPYQDDILRQLGGGSASVSEIAAAILGTFLLGQYMTNLEFSPVKLKLYSYHKWIGVTIFLLVLVRLAWRLAEARPSARCHSQPGWRRAWWRPTTPRAAR
jgi:hypothetical protein